MMSIYIPETNEIYFSKTKEYFNEVLSSYANGNYRSAVVMLYSTVICDILLKLKELKDMYNDSTANSILKEIERTKKESTSKSSWEKELLEKVRDKTNLIDSKVFSDLSHLYDDRCFSAHPAVNEDFELYTPNQETVIAHIKNILNGVLIKPPIFIKSVINMLTDDLKDKSAIYEGNKEALAVYLNNKYYRHMNESMKVKVFQSLWKFCFLNTEDENCKTYRAVNRQALNILVESIETIIKKELKDNENIYIVANDQDCLFQLVAFLSVFPPLYQVLEKDVKLLIDKHMEENGDARWGAWFKYKRLKDHLDYLKRNKPVIEVSHLKYVYDYYCKQGERNAIISFFIDLFSDSWNYDTADKRYSCCIRPFIKDFNQDEVEKLLQTINGNRQIYDRGAAKSTNTEIVKCKKEIFNADFDFSKYPHFEFDESILKEDANNAD